jgi:hypothetical protein
VGALEFQISRDFEIEGLVFRVYGYGLKIEECGVKDVGFVFRVEGQGCGVWGFGYWVQG